MLLCGVDCNNMFDQKYYTEIAGIVLSKHTVMIVWTQLIFKFRIYFYSHKLIGGSVEHGTFQEEEATVPVQFPQGEEETLCKQVAGTVGAV